MFSLMYFVLLPSHLTHQSPIVSAYGLPIFQLCMWRWKRISSFWMIPDMMFSKMLGRVNLDTFGCTFARFCKVFGWVWIVCTNSGLGGAGWGEVGWGAVRSSAVHLADVSRDPRLSGPSGSRLSAFAWIGICAVQGGVVQGVLLLCFWRFIFHVWRFNILLYESPPAETRLTVYRRLQYFM